MEDKKTYYNRINLFRMDHAIVRCSVARKARLVRVDVRRLRRGEGGLLVLGVIREGIFDGVPAVNVVHRSHDEIRCSECTCESGESGESGQELL